jgi:putative flippase GtrA
MLRAAFDRVPGRYRQFAMFGFAGGIAFVVDVGILSLLTAFLGIDPLTAGLISFCCGLVTTWLINRTLAFRDRPDQPLWQEFLRYCAVNGLGGLIHVTIYGLLVENVPFIHDHPQIGKAAGVACALVFNFTGSKYFVYRRSAS